MKWLKPPLSFATCPTRTNCPRQPDVHFFVGWVGNAYIDVFLTRFTLLETNIAPENRPSQKEFHLPTIHFQVLC